VTPARTPLGAITPNTAESADIGSAGGCAPPPRTQAGSTPSADAILLSSEVEARPELTPPVTGAGDSAGGPSEIAAEAAAGQTGGADIPTGTLQPSPFDPSPQLVVTDHAEEPPKKVTLPAAKLLAELRTPLQTKTSDWKERMAALAKLREALQGCDVTGGGADAATLARRLEPLVGPLQVQLTELRSAIIREACRTVEAVAAALGEHFEPIALELLPMLIDLTACAKKVMATSGVTCLTKIVQCCCSSEGAALSAVIAQVQGHKDARTRAQCMAVVTMVLEQWSDEHLTPHGERLREMLAQAMQDASSDVRSEARKSFAIYWRVWPESGDMMLASQPMSVRKALRREFPGLKSSVLAQLGTTRVKKTDRPSAKEFMRNRRKQMRAKAAPTVAAGPTKQADAVPNSPSGGGDADTARSPAGDLTPVAVQSEEAGTVVEAQAAVEPEKPACAASVEPAKPACAPSSCGISADEAAPEKVVADVAACISSTAARASSLGADSCIGLVGSSSGTEEIPAAADTSVPSNRTTKAPPSPLAVPPAEVGDALALPIKDRILMWQNMQAQRCLAGHQAGLGVPVLPSLPSEGSGRPSHAPLTKTDLDRRTAQIQGIVAKRKAAIKDGFA
jgi:hypothetical protein